MHYKISSFFINAFFLFGKAFFLVSFLHLVKKKICIEVKSTWYLTKKFIHIINKLRMNLFKFPVEDENRVTSVSIEQFFEGKRTLIHFFLSFSIANNHEFPKIVRKLKIQKPNKNIYFFCLF